MLFPFAIGSCGASLDPRKPKIRQSSPLPRVYLAAGIMALLHWRKVAPAGERGGMKRRLRPVPVAPNSAFGGFRFPPEIIVLAVHWYLPYGLSYRDVEERLRCGTGVGCAGQVEALC